MDLKETACPRLPVNRENFQTKMILNGALGWLSLLDHLSERNSGLSAMRSLSASATYSRVTE